MRTHEETTTMKREAEDQGPSFSFSAFSYFVLLLAYLHKSRLPELLVYSRIPQRAIYTKRTSFLLVRKFRPRPRRSKKKCGRIFLVLQRLLPVDAAGAGTLSKPANGGGCINYVGFRRRDSKLRKRKWMLDRRDSWAAAWVLSRVRKTGDSSKRSMCF